MQNLSRPAMAGIALIIGVVVIALLSLALPQISPGAARVMLDYGSSLFPYPVTIQNLLILLFIVGLGEIFLRWRDASIEMGYVEKHYLPDDENDRTVLQGTDLGPVRQKVLSDIKSEGAFLPNMINRCIIRFQASDSVDEANSVLNAMSEIYFHQIDLKYAVLRYIAWVIPTIGFIGTVVGIAYSLSFLGGTSSANPDNMLRELTTKLAVAFNTTMVALVLSAILMFFIYTIQEKEEKSLNKAMEYCLNNLINRLYTA